MKLLRRHVEEPSEPEPLTDELRQWLSETITVPTFAGIPATDEFGRPLGGKRFDQMACQWCGGVHIGYCPRVAEVSFLPGGGVERVRFVETKWIRRFPWSKPERQTWDDRGVIFGDQLVELKKDDDAPTE